MYPSLLPAVLLRMRSTLCSAPFNFFFNFLSVRHPSTLLSINRILFFVRFFGFFPSAVRTSPHTRTPHEDD